ncbi:hypothetical protein TWF506_011104 [Arthrobotrys conoides]|uniref:F-box domain-containing protein n=1 Tax=Arthrobotrys conoides TaxID=74498 RepID=A0AAN8NG08_9PEZI
MTTSSDEERKNGSAVEQALQQLKRTTMLNLGVNYSSIGDFYKRNLILKQCVQSFISDRKAFLDAKAKRDQRETAKIELLPTEIMLVLVDHMPLADAKKFSLCSQRCRAVAVRRIFEKVHCENRPAEERLGRASWPVLVQNFAKYTKSVVLTADVRVRSRGGVLQLAPDFNVEYPARQFFDVGIIEATQPFKNLHSLELIDTCGITWLGFCDGMSRVLSTCRSLKTLSITPYLIEEKAPAFTYDSVNLDIPFSSEHIRPLAANHARLSKLVINFEDEKDYRFNIDVENFFHLLRFCGPATATVEIAEVKLSIPFQNWCNTSQQNGENHNYLFLRLPALRELVIRSQDILKHPVIPIHTPEDLLLEQIKTLTIPYYPEKPDITIQLLSQCPEVSTINVVIQYTTSDMAAEHFGYKGSMYLSLYAKRLWQDHEAAYPDHKRLESIGLYEQTSSCDDDIIFHHREYFIASTSDNGIELQTK